MVNRPKNKGTFAESTVATYLKENGWPHAERRALAGVLDKGDITGTPGLAWEVKYAGSGIRMGEWVAEMLQETKNAQAEHGILVIKPPARGAKRVHEWLAVMVNWDFNLLSSVHGEPLRVQLLQGAPEGYSATKMTGQLFSLANIAQASELAVLTLRPRGMREAPENWYRIMTFGDMVQLLRACGYGSPLS